MSLLSQTSLVQEPRLHLQQREVSTTQDCFGTAKRINLGRTSILAHVKVLQEPIALSMQRGNVVLGGEQFLASRALLFCVCLKFGLHVSLCCLFLSQSLGVSST